MNYLNLDTRERYKNEIIFIVFTLLCFLFRSAIPFLKYPFLVLFMVFFIYAIIKYRGILIKKSLGFLESFYIPVLVFVLIIIYFAFSNKVYLIVFKDIASTLILLSFFLLLHLIVDSTTKFNYFYDNFVKLLIFFAFLTSVFTLFVQFDILAFHDFVPKNPLTFKSAKESIDIDNNFALLPVYFGLFSIFFFLRKIESQSQKIICIILLSLFTLDIILSASKRGLISLLTILVFFVLIKGIYYFKLSKKKKQVAEINRAADNYFLSLGILVLLTSAFLYLTSYNLKSRTLKALGTRDVAASFNRVTKNIYEYIQVFNQNATYTGLYNRIWRPVFNSDEPDYGWGSRNHKTIDKLKGKNVGIVPEGAKGYMLDSTCNADIREGNAYAFTLIDDKKTDKKHVTGAIVFCYVSEDFNGEYAMMALEGTGPDYKRISYDLSNKGTWQKLSLKFDYEKSEPPLYLYIAKFGVLDFSSLKGYVIFASPTFEESSKADSLNPGISVDSNVLKPDYFKSLYIASNRSIDLKKIYKKVNLQSFGSLSPAFSYEKGILNSLLAGNSDTSDTHKISDQDPIRRWVSDFISEDTAYYGLKLVIFHDSITDNFINIRKVHWLFSWQIYKQEYDIPHKLFGSGFNYLNWFGYYFLKDKTASDWPHNPFLSVLLYSGLIGLIIYLFFLYKVFLLYFKYIKEYLVLFLCFLITFFFTFFSGSSPFDPPMMGFFVLLPFFIHNIHKTV